MPLAYHGSGFGGWVADMAARGLVYRAINSLTRGMSSAAIMALAAIAILVAWNMRHR